MIVNNNKSQLNLGKIVLFSTLTIFVFGFIANSAIRLNYNNIARLNFPTSSS